MKKILITGGTGLLGSNLTKQLENNGYEVSYLSRNPKKGRRSMYFFFWGRSMLSFFGGKIHFVFWIWGKSMLFFGFGENP